jgi:hypothetical protein
MKPLATLSMWSNVVAAHSCRIQVYEAGCSVEMRTGGEVVFAVRCATLAEAFEEAELLRLTYGVDAPYAPAARSMAYCAA